jgi:hypothetical protein
LGGGMLVFCLSWVRIPLEREDAMAEHEPKVAPIIRLPQIRAERGAATAKAPEFFLEPERKGTEAGGGEDEAEALLSEAAGLKSPLKSQISGDQPKFTGESSGARGLSTRLRRALLNFAEQERQRTRMVTILVLVQAAVLLAALPGYLFGPFQLAGFLVTLGGLALCGVVWLLNWLDRTGEASFLLVLGGVALVVLDVLLSAAQLVSLETLHLSLLFLLVILGSGILFSPETALILSILSAIFTALVVALFHSTGPLAAVFNAQGYYLSLVYLVLVQPAVGVVAWLFGRQMQESVHLVTYVSGLNMSNKRLSKRLRETDEQKRHLEAGVAIIQQTHARVAAGDYSARAHVEGDLLPLAVSLNLMLERVESFVHGEHERERMETAVAGLAELAGRVGEEGQSRLPAPTGTALDGLSIAIKQMQTNVNQRLAKVQQSTTALMATVGRCQDGLLPVAEVLQEHLRSIDALVLAADNIMNSAQRQIEFSTQAEQLLLAAAPAGVDLKAVEEQPRKGTSALRLAEELERRAALIHNVEPSPAVPEQTPAAEDAAPTAEEALIETAVPAPEEQPTEVEASPSEEAQPAAVTMLTQDEASAEESALAPTEAEALVDEATGVETQPPAEASAASALAVPTAEPEAAKLEAASRRDGSNVWGPAEDKKVTLADVDREVAEDEAFQEPDWNVGQLRELVGVLGNLAGEATLQERNARTLTFKLRAMLQGMPNTRRLDMMAAWLRTALEAVSQSAEQVQQASKTIPASAFQPTRKERAGAADRD